MKTTPKDFFLHLGATISLYVAAIALMNLSFTAIDRALPDSLNAYWSASSAVWPISILIVLVPLLYVLEWLVSRDLRRMPEKIDVWIRRWRIYLTLFLTGATIAGDLIALINTYLNGEITARFIWKVIIVLLVSAVIFTYYILAKAAQIHQPEYAGRNWQYAWRKILAWIGAVLVLAAVVAGFVVTGSPGRQRELRFDSMRENDVSNIAYSVGHYWQQFGRVPARLSDMPEYMSGLPADPENHLPYDYKPGTSTDSFSVCATFFASSTPDAGANYQLSRPVGAAFSDVTHGAGLTCFKRAVNPVDFPPMPMERK